VESGDVCLDEGYRTGDEKGIDGSHLVIERVLHTFWGVEYEDDWRVINLMVQDIPSICETYSNRMP